MGELWGLIITLIILFLSIAISIKSQTSKSQNVAKSYDMRKDNQKASSEPLRKGRKDSSPTPTFAPSMSQPKPQTASEKINSRQISSSQNHQKKISFSNENIRYKSFVPKRKTYY